MAISGVWMLRTIYLCSQIRRMELPYKQVLSPQMTTPGWLMVKSYRWMIRMMLCQLKTNMMFSQSYQSTTWIINAFYKAGRHCGGWQKPFSPTVFGKYRSKTFWNNNNDHILLNGNNPQKNTEMKMTPSCKAMRKMISLGNLSTVYLSIAVVVLSIISLKAGRHGGEWQKHIFPTLSGNKSSNYEIENKLIIHAMYFKLDTSEMERDLSLDHVGLPQELPTRLLSALKRITNKLLYTLDQNNLQNLKVEIIFQIMSTKRKNSNSFESELYSEDGSRTGDLDSQFDTFEDHEDTTSKPKTTRRRKKSRLAAQKNTSSTRPVVQKQQKVKVPPQLTPDLQAFAQFLDKKLDEKIDPLKQFINENSKFQREINHKVKVVQAEVQSNKRKIQEVDNRQKVDQRTNVQSIKNLTERIQNIEQHGLGDMAAFAIDWQQHDALCIKHSKIVGLYPVGPRQASELKEYLVDKGIEVTQQNLVPYQIRNFMINDMNIDINIVKSIEDAVREITHDGDHTAWLLFQTEDDAKRLWNLCKGFAQGCAAMGKFGRKLKLKIVPALLENWRYVDNLGYKYRKENGRGYQSRNMLVKRHDFPGGWCYRLEIRYPGDTMYHPYQLKEGEVLPGPNLATTELPLAMYESLDWNNYIPQLMQENIRAGVEQVTLKFRPLTRQGKVRSPEVSQELWTACLGEGDEQFQQRKDYWASFKPNQAIYAALKDIMMPVEDPDFTAYHYNMKAISLKDRLHFDIITPAEYQYELAKLNEELTKREDAEQIIQQLEREHDVHLQRNSRDTTRADDTVMSYGDYIQTLDGQPISGVKVVDGKPVGVQQQPASKTNVTPAGAEGGSAVASGPAGTVGGAKLKPTNPWNTIPGRPKVHSTPMKGKDNKDPLK